MDVVVEVEARRSREEEFACASRSGSRGGIALDGV